LELGARTESDLLKVKVQKGQFQSQLLSEEQRNRSLKRELNLLMGQDPAQELRLQPMSPEPAGLPDIQDARNLIKQNNFSLLALEKQIAINDEELIVDVSMGISLYPNDANHYPKLLKTAASALNNVKANKGRRFEFYDKEINTLSIQKYELQNKLRNALSNQEFVLHYQPQMNMATNQIVGLEALIRWNSANGMVPPASFIAIAEESNLIIPLGEWVLENACEFGKKLATLGYQTPIAVNLSMLQFKSPYIGDLLQSILTKTNLPPELLELEITEGILMDNEDECESILSQFHAMGIQVSIDDFGTGYSSLSYLKKFAVDKIKIDRSFIKGIPHYDNGTIAKVIIELAGNFNLQVIAEGVETPEQIDFLLKNNCHIAQGFYYAKPLDEDELLAFMEKSKRDNG